MHRYYSTIVLIYLQHSTVSTATCTPLLSLLVSVLLIATRARHLAVPCAIDRLCLVFRVSAPTCLQPDRRTFSARFSEIRA